MLRQLLLASSVEPTPRQILALKMEGGIGELVTQLSQESASTGDTATLTRLLYIIEISCSIDAFFASELGQLGGFQCLQQLSTSLCPSVSDLVDTDDTIISEVRDQLDSAIGSIVCCGGCATFPRVPLESATDVEHLKPLCFRFVDSAGEGEDGEEGGARFGVVIRRVNKDLFFNQDSVGYVLWSAAVIQSRWLCLNPGFVKDEDVLELGAGVGLSGIVASRWAKSCVLTDFNDVVLRNLKANCSINVGSELIEGLSCATSTTCAFSVCKLDWTSFGPPEPPELESDPGTIPALAPRKFERIIGSDVICCADDVTALCRVLNEYLAPTESARAFFVVASSDHRWGVETFVPSLKAISLDVKFRPLRHSVLYDAARYGGKSSAPLRGDFIVPDDIFAEAASDDDHLLVGLDEAEYYSWQVIFCKWKKAPKDKYEN